MTTTTVSITYIFIPIIITLLTGLAKHLALLLWMCFSTVMTYGVIKNNYSFNLFFCNACFVSSCCWTSCPHQWYIYKCTGIDTYMKHEYLHLYICNSKCAYIPPYTHTINLTKSSYSTGYCLYKCMCFCAYGFENIKMHLVLAHMLMYIPTS